MCVYMRGVFDNVGRLCLPVVPKNLCRETQVVIFRIVILFHMI